MKYIGFKRILIGFIFVFFHFRLQDFDILPDPVGYLFIIAGLMSLSSLHNSFRKAISFVVGSLILSIIDIFSGFDVDIDISYGIGEDMGIIFITSILNGVLWIAFLYFLGKGMADLFKDHDLYKEAYTINNCINCNIIAKALTCMPFILFFMVIPFLILFLIIINVIFNIWLMVQVYLAYKILSQHDNTSFETGIRDY